MTTLRVTCLARSRNLPSPAVCLQALDGGMEPMLLESSSGDGFTVLAWSPDRHLRGNVHPDGRDDHAWPLASTDPAQLLEDASADESWEFEAGLPHVGVGWIGWFGFECGHAFENFPWNPPYPDGWPDYHFARYRQALVWLPDGECLLLQAQVQGNEDRARALQWFEKLQQVQPEAEKENSTLDLTQLSAEIGEHRFCADVTRLRDWIGEGELFQANLSHFLSGPFRHAARALYAQLRESQPTAMSAYWEDARGHALVSHSPERFLQVRGASLLTEPIKGTAKRGASAEEDVQIAADLEVDQKEVAELTMIVDMARNDLGRIAEVGAVEVPSAGEVESYPTLFHRIATVRARWNPEKGLAALLRATFPPASVTGAPKVRALQAIAELERRARGPYCGCLGYWIPGPEPHADFSVLIRTATLSRERLRLAVGAGIVWDSDPEREWHETLLKGRYLTGA
ncbi:MAG: anthranilate synthase component I family protein [Planctomycetota bacterium]